MPTDDKKRKAGKRVIAALPSEIDRIRDNRAKESNERRAAWIAQCQKERERNAKIAELEAEIERLRVEVTA